MGGVAAAGGEVREVAWPRAGEYARAASQVLAIEARAYHMAAYPGREADYGPLIPARLRSAGDVDAETYARALRLLIEARAGPAGEAVARIEVLAKPTVPKRARTIHQAKRRGQAKEWYTL